MKSIKNNLQFVILGLLVINLILTAVSLFSGPSSQARNVKDAIAESKAISEYYKELGRDNFKVVDDSVYTASYGTKSIKGVLKNTGKKKFDSVTVMFKLYKDDVCVGNANEYISYSEPGDEIPFEAYITNDDFDEYKLAYISATE